MSQKVTGPRGGRSLRTQLAITIAVGQLLAIAVLSLPIIEGRDTIIYHQARQMAMARARLGATFVGHRLDGTSPTEMSSMLEAFLTSPDVVEASIVRGDAVLARVAAASRGAAAGPAVVPAPELHDSAEGFTVMVPLEGAHPATQLRFRFSTRHLTGQISGVITRTLVLIVVALAVGMFAAYTLSLTVVRRVERIARSTGAIAQGDLAQRLPVDGPAELADLSSSFNEMVEVVAASRQQLIEANSSLERRVEERTRQLIEAQEELVEAERLGTVGEMSAQLAHDLRSPLATVMLNAEMLAEEMGSDPCSTQAPELIDRIKRSLARVDVALGEYLAFSGLGRLQRTPADVNDTVRMELESLGEWLLSRRIRLVLRLGSGMPATLVDVHRMRHAVRSLVRNAVDAMREGGTLTVTTRPDGGRVQIRFSDEGGPIEPALQRDLFKLFSGRRPNSNGPGLRLAREVAELHGGTLELERTDNVGSTFVVCLPVAAGRGCARDGCHCKKRASQLTMVPMSAPAPMPANLPDSAPVPALPSPSRTMLPVLAARMVPSFAKGDAAYRTAFLRIVVDALRERPPALRRQFELFVSAIRWLPVLRHGRKFERLGSAEQDAMLAWLQDCPVPLLRKGFWGLKALVFMGHYGQEPVARALGFGPEGGQPA